MLENLTICKEKSYLLCELWSIYATVAHGGSGSIEQGPVMDSVDAMEAVAVVVETNLLVTAVSADD